MPDEKTTPPADPTIVTVPPVDTPPAAKPEEKKDDTETRINQLLARAKTAEEELKTFKAKEAQDAEIKMVKNGEHEKLLTEYKAKLETSTLQLERMTKLEETLNHHLETQIALIPEGMRKLIPESYSVEEKLKYINENSILLMGNTKPPSNGNPVPSGTAPVGEIDVLEKRFNEFRERVSKGETLNHMESMELRAIPQKIKDLKEKV